MDETQKILSDITVFNKYAKFIPEKNRRETWIELCRRNMDMHINKYPHIEMEIREVYAKYVMPKKVLPSMRSMQFGGRPIEISNIRIYNCAYLPIDNIAAFNETMFLLLSGTGVGYSVQKKDVEKLSIVVGPNKNRNRRYVVSDCIEGWADAVKILTKAYFLGRDNPVFDYRDIRPKGARLITSGGKAPGPEPLRTCIDRIAEVLEKAVGRVLKPIEAHDIQCHIADAVLSGGIRRAAMISLFDKDDEEMLTCKSNLKVEDWEFEKTPEGSWQGWCIYKGERQNMTLSDWDYQNLTANSALPWYFFEQQRGRANNSAVLHRGDTTEEQFMALWKKVEESQAGEPGIFWTNDYNLGTNPCAEIALKACAFCNLSEVNVSDVETQEELNARVRAGAFLGTLQAGYTDFHYLRPIWRETTEKDALLGVGMTGIGSGKVLNLDLRAAAAEVEKENARVADLIGINRAARLTCIKPSGTTSLVLGSSSGIHAWHNDYYIRRMRVGKNEPLYHYIKETVPELIEDCKFKPNIESVLSIPQKAPAGAIYRTEPYIELLERVKRFYKQWILEGHRDGSNSHNVSVTVSLKPEDWKGCGEWMWKNRNFYAGISVLPYDGGTYVQAPFEDITEEQFNEMVKHVASIDLSKVIETVDITDHKAEVACGGGACEVV